LPSTAKASQSKAPVSKNETDGEPFASHLNTYHEHHLLRTLKALKEYKPSEIEKARMQAAQGLIKLRELAWKDLKALEVLATELRLHVAGLKSDALENQEHYRTLMRRCSIWPAFVSVDKEVQEAQLDFAKTMKLGDGSPYNFKGRKWSWKTPENKVAIRLVEYIQATGGHKLPPFSKSTVLCWWRHIRKERLLEHLGGKKFENNRMFKTYDTTAYRDSAKNQGLSFETWKRKQILSRLLQSLHSIARVD
jgi:hypothetical protein